MDKKKIIYVGNFDFPFGNASGKRVYGNGKLLRAIGYEPIFVGMTRDIKNAGSLQETEKEYDGFKYYSYPYPRGSRDWVNYKQILKSFLTWAEESKDSIYAIICYGSLRLSRFITEVYHWAKKNDIFVVSDCVDWLESKTGNLVFDLAKTADTLYQKVIANRQVDGVICISSYLEKYYHKAGKKTLIIPPLATACERNIRRSEQEERLQLVYAGSPFKAGIRISDPATLKDRVDIMIDLLGHLKQSNVDFCFYYYGLDKDNYLSVFPGQAETISYLGDSIRFCGMRKNEEVMEKIKEADFTMLIRDVKKSTMAGFPTKVSESISCGTPVITTRTSDIDKYLSEGENVVFVNQTNLEEAAEKIKHLVQEKQYIKMKENCAGNDIFYFQSYADDMKRFLEML